MFQCHRCNRCSCYNISVYDSFYEDYNSRRTDSEKMIQELILMTDPLLQEGEVSKEGEFTVHVHPRPPREKPSARVSSRRWSVRRRRSRTTTRTVSWSAQDYLESVKWREILITSPLMDINTTCREATVDSLWWV